MDLTPHERDDRAAYALDALETDELKAFDAQIGDAEARGEPFRREIATWREALGQLAGALEPPTPRRAGGVDLAGARRRPGTALHDVTDLSARDAFALTVRELGRLLGTLGPSDWEAPAVEGWDVKGLLAHLVATETYFGRQLGLWDLAVDPLLEPDHLGMSREFVSASGAVPVAELVAEWRERVDAIVDRLDELDEAAFEEPFHFHFLDTTLGTILVTRVFEVWTHQEDICRATGRPLAAPDPGRLRRMSRIAVPSLPFGLALSGVAVSGRTARIVLTGPGGGTWIQPLALGERPGSPEVTLVLDVVDYCRLASRRAAPDDVAVDIEGDAALGRDVLLAAGVFSA